MCFDDNCDCFYCWISPPLLKTFCKIYYSLRWLSYEFMLVDDRTHFVSWISFFWIKSCFNQLLISPNKNLRGWLAVKTQWWILLFLTLQASPSRGWDVKFYILGYSPIELAHSFYSLLVVCFCLCGSFEYISFFKLSQQYSIFSFCSSHFCPICLIGPFSCISLHERL